MDNRERIIAAFATMDGQFQEKTILIVEALAELNQKMRLNLSPHPKNKLFLVKQPVLNIVGNRHTADGCSDQRSIKITP